MKLAIMIMMLASACVAADEVETPLQTMYVEKVCECGGKMKPTGVCRTTNPPQYPHLCDKCGKEKTYNEVYPVIRYSEFEAVEEFKTPETNDVCNAYYQCYGTNIYYYGLMVSNAVDYSTVITAGPVTIDCKTGKVTIQEGVTLDEAAIKFWEAVEMAYPKLFKAEGGES